MGDWAMIFVTWQGKTYGPYLVPYNCDGIDEYEAQLNASLLYLAPGSGHASVDCTDVDGAPSDVTIFNTPEELAEHFVNQ